MREPCEFGRVVGDMQDGDSRFPVNSPQFFGEFLAQQRVELPERLVQEQDSRLSGEGSRKCQSLRLPARKLRGLAVLAMRDAHFLEDLGSPRGSLLSWNRRRIENELQMLLRREMGPEREALEHHADAAFLGSETLAGALKNGFPEPDASCRERSEPCNGAQQRAFPASGRTENSQVFARSEIELHGAQTERSSDADFDPIQAKTRHAAPFLVLHSEAASTGTAPKATETRHRAAIKESRPK